MDRRFQMKIRLRNPREKETADSRRCDPGVPQPSGGARKLVKEGSVTSSEYRNLNTKHSSTEWLYLLSALETNIGSTTRWREGLFLLLRHEF
jgi:hypothetical protein